MNQPPDTPSSPPERRKCSLCGTHFVVLNRALLPFCSSRCQMMDLGKWLAESYGLPWEDPNGIVDVASDDGFEP